MRKFRLFSSRISTLLVLFLTTTIAVISIDSSVVALPDLYISQRTTSPGSTPSAPVVTPPTTPEVQIPIFVPLPKRPLPGSTQTTPTPTPTPTTVPQIPTNHMGRVLTAGEKEKISAYLRSRNIGINTSVKDLGDTRFILHDTSVAMPPSVLERERNLGRGPLGLGVNAFLPRTDAAVIARPNFYEPRRPTTTEFEKASDVLVRADREVLLRQVWRSTNSDARLQALDTALANLNLTVAEIAKEQQEARSKLAAASGRIFTTATWAVEAICTRYQSGDRSVLASSSQADSMDDACGTLTNYFKIRNSRVKSSVAAEIVQVGARSARGNQNTCDANNSNIATLPNPAYSDNQYNYALGLYLRAALSAGKFPQTTTHFALDTFDPEAHCDPRCFNLTKLYAAISSVMGHAPGSTYGITPSYGTRLGTHNIWWNDRICHGSAP
jgi:hypothetical protein